MINLIKENIIEMFAKDYYWFRQRLPIFIYFFYLRFKNSESPEIKKAVKISISLIVLGLCYTMSGFIFKFPFESIIPLNWHYPGLVVWTVFFLIYYFILTNKNYSELTAFSLAAMATVGGGWLYEVSWNHPLAFFLTKNSIFLINGQILCLLFLAYELRKKGFKLKTLNCFGFGFFAFTWIIFYLNFWGIARYFKILTGSTHFFQWAYRVPTCFFLLSLLSGIKRGYIE